MKKFRAETQSARSAYHNIISQRMAAQREVNQLLQTRQNWNPTDLERFTSLYAEDHNMEKDEQVKRDMLKDADRKLEEAQSELVQSMLSRYHEEQLWSDKIRQLSTWGTFGLMFLNVTFFVIVQLLIEPRKRQKLIQEMEVKLRDAMESMNAIESISKEQPLANKISEIQKVVSEVSEVSDSKENVKYRAHIEGALIGAFLSAALTFLFI